MPLVLQRPDSTFIFVGFLYQVSPSASPGVSLLVFLFRINNCVYFFKENIEVAFFSSRTTSAASASTASFVFALSPLSDHTRHQSILTKGSTAKGETA